jgi:hypothetical protein
VNKERIALALSVLSRRLKFRDMDNDECALLGFEREFSDSYGFDVTAEYAKNTHTKSQAIEMAERIILQALTEKEETTNG